MGRLRASLGPCRIASEDTKLGTGGERHIIELLSCGMFLKNADPVHLNLNQYTGLVGTLQSGHVSVLFAWRSSCWRGSAVCALFNALVFPLAQFVSKHASKYESETTCSSCKQNSSTQTNTFCQ